MNNLNASPKIEFNLINDGELTRIYYEMGLIFGDEKIRTYEGLVSLIENTYKENLEDYLKKIKACSRSIFIRNILDSGRLSNIASRYGIKAPVSFSYPVMHISSMKIFSSDNDLNPHQDWPSCLGSYNSIIIWICLGGATKESGGLDFYCSDQNIALLKGEETSNIVSTYKYELSKLQKKYIHIAAGDALVFGQFIPHGSQNGNTRISVSIRIEDAGEEYWKERGYEYAQKTIVNRKNFSELEMLKINAEIKKN